MESKHTISLDNGFCIRKSGATEERVSKLEFSRTTQAIGQLDEN